MVTRFDGTCENFGNLPYSPPSHSGVSKKTRALEVNRQPLDYNIDGRENEMVVTF